MYTTGNIVSRCSILSIAILATSLVCSCIDAPPISDIPGHEIMRKSADEMNKLESYHQTAYTVPVEGAHLNWAAVPIEKWNMISDSRYVATDRCYVLWLSKDSWSEHIIIADKQWWRGESRACSQMSWIPSGQACNTSTSKSVRSVEVVDEGFEGCARFDEVEILGSAIINGTDCFHLRCTVEPKEIPGYEEPLPTLIADYWVGKSDYLIRQMVHISQIQDIDTDEVGYYVVRVSDFNQPFEIEPPPTDDTEPSDLPFPEGTFYTGESGYENHPQLVAPGSTLSLNEGQYYVVYPGSMNSNGDIPDELYARIYAKQADPLNAGSPLRKVRSGTGSAAWPWIDTSEWIEISELTGDGTKNCDSVSKARVE